jgi:hypothetical protein
MEIATLQQIISQESRAGSGASDSPANTFISESNQGATNNPLTIPVITGENVRGNTPIGPWTSDNFYVYMNSINDAGRIVHFLLGGQMNSFPDHQGRPPEIQFHNRRGGIDCNTVVVPNNNVSYGPFYASLHFVRNPTSSAISFSYTNSTASKWQSGYDGAGAGILTPNATTYAGVTDFTWSSKYTYNSSTYIYNGTIAHTVQPGETIAIVTAHTFVDWTTFSNGGHWSKNFNPQYNNLWTGGLVPDYKLYAAYHQLRDRDSVSSTKTTGISGLVDIYNMAGASFGENV